ncbi:MAG: hypothetical protein R3277_04600 [Brumimicrobium sp.]|nr:hypothetical protein [Brumimicrobium sp.]
MSENKRTKAQEATQAIERIYITMRHLFNRGFYKPMGISGVTLRESLLELQPEIYGTIAEDKLELNGLIYVMDRLPLGIEECSVINLTGDEGYKLSKITPIIPPKRRRNCYRIDEEQINIEITRGRSDIYDILTHLTFLFIESHKIAKRVIIDENQALSREWLKLEETVRQKRISKEELEVALVHTANIIGRTFEETLKIYNQLNSKEHPHRFLKMIYWLGKLAILEVKDDVKRTILFSPILRERLGHHIHGEKWANNIKEILEKRKLIDKPIHIISANMHSVMNYLFAKQAGLKPNENLNKRETFELLSIPENESYRKKIVSLAQKQGMTFYEDTSGTNIDVQIFDLSKVDFKNSYAQLKKDKCDEVIIVMDYAFGEQAFETMDELLKPYKKSKKGVVKLNISSISIMGKAGILTGGKGDIMIPTAHVFEGTTDNYPFRNELSLKDFENEDVKAFEGHMITVLGTSLQNKEMLKYFRKSTWRMVGLEMEGAHYQKAIQAASKIRNSIREDVKIRYAYYASDNPLETGSTLASGGLGLTGVKPTYLITEKILEQVINC